MYIEIIISINIILLLLNFFDTCDFLNDVGINSIICTHNYYKNL